MRKRRSGSLAMKDAIDDLFEGKPETLDPTEVAQLLGKTRQSIYKWLNEGTIPGYQIGSSWIIIRDELKAVLRGGGNAGKSQKTGTDKE